MQNPTECVSEHKTFQNSVVGQGREKRCVQVWLSGPHWDRVCADQCTHGKSGQGNLRAPRGREVQNRAHLVESFKEGERGALWRPGYWHWGRNQ